MNKYFVVAVHGLIKKGNKYLFTKRSIKNDYMPNLWDIPGGTIRFGEEIFAALKREVKEETNLEVMPKKLLFAYGYKSNKERHQFQLVYLCDYLSGNVKLDYREHSEYLWLEWEEIGKLKKIAFLRVLYNKLEK